MTSCDDLGLILCSLHRRPLCREKNLEEVASSLYLLRKIPYWINSLIIVTFIYWQRVVVRLRNEVQRSGEALR
jgi:hypothetical protein